jgi:hypothetical protein
MLPHRERGCSRRPAARFGQWCKLRAKPRRLSQISGARIRSHAFFELYFCIFRYLILQSFGFSQQLKMLSPRYNERM